MTDRIIESLGGWLMKRKTNEGFSMFSKDNKRWFKVQEVQVIEFLFSVYIYYFLFSTFNL